MEPVSETQETYDVIAAEYARRNATVDPQGLDDAGALAARLPPGSLVVDAGCGPGREIALLREHGLRVIGLDMSGGQLRAGGLSGVAQADMRRLPVRAGSVDAVWCRAALLHVARDDVRAVLDEFARVVRPRGELCLAVAEGDGEGWEVAWNYGSERRRWFTFHREPALTALLTAAGFEVHEVRRYRASREWLSLHARRVSP
jgi:SAM-dependent methyltransferase